MTEMPPTTPLDPPPAKRLTRSSSDRVIGDQWPSLTTEADQRAFESVPYQDRIAAETKATIRCIPFQRRKGTGKCMVTGKPSEGRVVFAKAY